MRVDYDDEALAADAAGDGDGGGGGGETPPLWRDGAAFPEHCRWGAAGTVFVTRRRTPPEEAKQGASAAVVIPADKYRLAAPAAPDEKTVMAVFGGRHKKPKGGYLYYDELWFYCVEDDRWVMAQPKGNVRPPARDHHSINYIYDTHSLYVFGGRVSEKAISSAVLDDLWVLKLGEAGQDREEGLVHVGKWRRVAPVSVAPRARYLHTAVSWYGANGAADGGIVVFGGEHIKHSGANPKLNDAWLYEPALNKWREVSADGCAPGATGEPTAPFMGMRFFEVFAGGVLLAGLGLFFYQRYHSRRRGYQSIDDEGDEGEF
uniref:Uncharacterized protein n=1 Tax=Phaeomonas parva TaxID=124430 RepID=A0A7S1XLL1_9STRA